jgi:hypothetical protein
MAGIFITQPVTILSPDQSVPGAIQYNVAQIQAASLQSSDSQIWELAGQALISIQQQLYTITNALQDDLPFPDTLSVTGPTGNLIAWLGYAIGNDNVSYSGLWAASAWFGGTGPSTALVTILADGDQVIIDATLEVIGGIEVGNTVTGPDVTILDNGIQVYNSSPSLVININDTSGIELFGLPLEVQDPVFGANVVVNPSGVTITGVGGVEIITLSSTSGISTNLPISSTSGVQLNATAGFQVAGTPESAARS